jgi:hypothetical protein
MANQDDEKTIINVKGVSAKSWERAKAAANRRGETMAGWISRACDTVADLEAGDALMPPNPIANLDPKTANPALTPDQLTARLDALASLMQAAAAVKLAKLAARAGTPLRAAQTLLLEASEHRINGHQ